jgi:hypothetical protein
LATVITSLASAIPVIGNHIVSWLWGGFLILEAFFNKNVMKKTLINARIGFSIIANILNYYLIQNIAIIRRQQAGLLNKEESFCFSNFQIITKKLYSSSCSDSQRLNAEDLMWFVGFVEGDGAFSVNKNGKYIKYEGESEPHPQKNSFFWGSPNLH